MKNIFQQINGTVSQISFKQANGNIIATLDSDSQYNLEKILNLYKPLVEDKPIVEVAADLGIGSRYLGSANYKIPFLRDLTN